MLVLYVFLPEGFPGRAVEALGPLALAATGKVPLKHGIKSFAYKDDAGEQHLFLSSHRKAHALWNIASDRGLRVGVVNWSTDYCEPRRLRYSVSATASLTPSGR